MHQTPVQGLWNTEFELHPSTTSSYPNTTDYLDKMGSGVSTLLRKAGKKRRQEEEADTTAGHHSEDIGRIED